MEEDDADVEDATDEAEAAAKARKPKPKPLPKVCNSLNMITPAGSHQYSHIYGYLAGLPTVPTSL